MPLAVEKVENYMNSLNNFYLSGILDTLLSLDNEKWMKYEKEKLITLLFDTSNLLNEEYQKKIEDFLSQK